LYNAIEKDRQLRGKIKVIGIGAGNSRFEVKVFKERYDVSFPLFDDVDFIAHKAFGDVRTPYFFAIRINDDESHQVIYSKLGSIKDPEKFLNLIIRLSGLNSGVGK